MNKWLFIGLLMVFTSPVLFAQRKPIASTDSIKSHATEFPKKKKKTYPFGMLSSRDIDQNLDSSTNHHTLYNLLLKAGLRQTFGSHGPITLFVADDDAFGKLSSGKLDSLNRPSGKFDLISLITYQAIQGQVSIRSLKRSIRNNKGILKLTSLSGGIIKATINSNDDIELTDETGGKSIVSDIDINTTNGVIHPISAVLIPKKKDY